MCDCGFRGEPGKPRFPYCEERPGAAHSRRDQTCDCGCRGEPKKTAGPILRGAAKCRTLQEGPGLPRSTAPWSHCQRHRALEPLYVGQVGSVRGVVVAKFTTSLDAGQVDLAKVARIWQFWWRHWLPTQVVASSGSRLPWGFCGGVGGVAYGAGWTEEQVKFAKFNGLQN